MRQKILTLLFAAFMMVAALSMNSEAAETEEIPVLEQMTGFSEVSAFVAAAQADTIEVVDWGYCGNSNVEWGITQDGVLILFGEGTMPNYGNYGAVPWARYREDIYGVVVLGQVKNIGAHSFQFCDHLEIVVIDEGVHSIGEGAFWASSVQEVYLPNSITTIEKSAFNACRELKEVTWPKNLKTLGDYAFYDCEVMEKAVLPHGLTTIGKSAFDCCYKLSSVSIPQTVTTIGKSAFDNCPITSVTIPPGVKKIESRTFGGCGKLKTVTIPEGVQEIGDYAFSSCKSLQKIIIPDTVTTIKVGAFSGCYGLKEVKLPAYLTRIPESMLFGCSTLQTVMIPSQVQEIGAHAFELCQSLENIRIPESTIEINNEAFRNCYNLKKIYIMNSQLTFGEKVFLGIRDKTTIYCHEGSTAHTYATENNHPFDFIDMSNVTERFADVAEGKWFVDSVQYVFDKGLMSGSGEYFNPTQNVTRAQFVTTLYRLAGSPEVTDYSACKDFSDVAEGKYYTDAVCWAYNEGITTGSDGKFNTIGNLTRQQMAAFFFRYAAVMGYDVSDSADFSAMLNADKVSDYAVEAMSWAVGAGLISGSEVKDDAGNVAYDLNPKGNTTRAQLSAILQRFCEKYEIYNQEI